MFYQSEDPSRTKPTRRRKEETLKIVEDKKRERAEEEKVRERVY